MLKLLKFSAHWCGPCRMLSPIWDKLVDEMNDVEFVAVDIDKNPDLATKYGVRAVPTMVFLKDEQVVDQILGLRTEAEIREKIERNK